MKIGNVEMTKEGTLQEFLSKMTDEEFKTFLVEAYVAEYYKDKMFGGLVVISFREELERRKKQS